MSQKPGRRQATRSERTLVPLQGRNLLVWRGVFALVALFDVGALLYSYPPFLAQQHSLCLDSARTSCGDYQLLPSQMAALQHFPVSLDAYAVYVIVLDMLLTLVFLLIGALLFWHKSHDRMGLFVSLFLITFGCLGISDVHIGALPDTAPLALAIFGYLTALLQWTALGLFFSLFPDGRFVPRWSWLLSVLFTLQAVFYFLPSPYDINHWPLFLKLLVTLVVYGSAIATLLYRYLTVATALQRQQIKWLTFGYAMTFFLFFSYLWIVPAIFALLDIPTFWYPLLLPLFQILSYLFIPLSIGIALLRYRLWEIDTLINRALVYVLLTGTLLAIYVGLVVSGQAILVRMMKQTSGVMLVISTLAVAWLFQPLQQRIQAFIDQRFYRPKYDAMRTIHLFSATLRNEVELSQLQAQLLQVVVETMQPEHISLWLCQVQEGQRGPSKSDINSTEGRKREK